MNHATLLFHAKNSFVARALYPHGLSARVRHHIMSLLISPGFLSLCKLELPSLHHHCINALCRQNPTALRDTIEVDTLHITSPFTDRGFWGLLSLLFLASSISTKVSSSSRAQQFNHCNGGCAVSLTRSSYEDCTTPGIFCWGHLSDLVSGMAGRGHDHHTGRVVPVVLAQRQDLDRPEGRQSLQVSDSSSLPLQQVQ